jgi:hypothetical protein
MPELENLENSGQETGINQDSSFETDSQSLNNSESLSEGSQPAIETQNKQEFNENWWESDPAKVGMWKTKDGLNTNAVLKSYYHLEKEFNSKYKPAFSEYEKLKQTFNKLGVKPEELETNWQEYQTLKDPNHENNQFISKVNYFLQNPEYATTLQTVFQDLQRRDLQRQFPGYTDEQIQQQLAIKERMNQLEAKEKEREEQLKQEQMKVQQAEIAKQVETNSQEIYKFAKDMGIQITEETIAQYFDFLQKNNLPPSAMKGAFMQMFEKELFKNIQKQAGDNTLKNLNKQNSKVIPTAHTTKTTTVNKDEAFKQKLKNFFT